ncbi:hypothetical protein I79_006081 [Cricetulus griseus]|uniref:Uncharacterized protein n=1 Tax=Cricetulus griseus TaxID=10029 RepID=G3H6W1_CRIGR|nr:hypothetical protein I79_006081 [Cricetulus griseus]
MGVYFISPEGLNSEGICVCNCRVRSTAALRLHLLTNLYQDRLTQAGAGDIIQQLKALAVVAEFLSSIPNIHMVAHNHL